MKKIIILLSMITLALLGGTATYASYVDSFGVTRYNSIDDFKPENELLGDVRFLGTVVTTSTSSTKVSLERGIIIYKYVKPVSFLINRFDSVISYYQAGSSASCTYEISETEETSYAETVSSTLALSTNISLEATINCVIAEETYTAQFEETLSTQYGETLQTSYSVTTTKSYNKTYAVNVDGYYYFEQRGLFNVYVFQEYTHVIENKKVGTSMIPISKYYTLDKECGTISLINDTVIGLFKYKLNQTSTKFVIDTDYVIDGDIITYIS